MIRDRVLALLRQVADGQVDINAALDRLARDPFESLPFATIDHHRALRQGYPEVILGQGKTTDQVVIIAERIAARGEGFLVTRASGEALGALAAGFPRVEVNELARCAYLAPHEPTPRGSGTILIAAERTGRHARTIEIDPKYVDVAVRRWQLYTGKRAYDAASGMSFEECEEAASACSV